MTVPVPIICNLNAGAAHRQVDQWHDLLSRASTGTERLAATEVSVRLVDDPDLVASVIALSRREKACCPFFDFALRIETEALTLHVGVPDDAVSLLDDLQSGEA